MFTLKMDGDLENLKIYLSRCMRSGDREVNFKFEEGVTTGTFNFELVKFYLNKIQELFPNEEFNYSISYGMKDSSVLNTEKCKELEEVDELFREKFNKELIVSDSHSMGFGFRDTLKASRKLDDIVNKIKNETNNGEPLSPFEKYMLAYEYVTEFVYNEGGDLFHAQTSDWVPVMNGDKIVCAGYASLLKELCDRIFTQKEVTVLKQSLYIYNAEGKGVGGHANNLVYIKDEKYNIDGLFYSDPCWDSKDNDRKTYSFCCIPLQDVLHMNYNKLLFDSGNITDIYLKQFNEYIGDNSNLVDDIKNYLSNEKFAEEFNCFKDESFSPLKYDKPFLNFQERKKLYSLEDELNLNYKNKFSDLMDKYKNIYIPKFTQDRVKKIGIEEELSILKSGNFTDEEFEKITEKLAKIFSSQEIQEEVKEMNKVIITAENFMFKMKKFYVTERTARLENQLLNEQESKIAPLREKNAADLLDNINRKTNSVVPIQAFVNHFKFLGATNGLKDEELKEFVKSKINFQSNLNSKIFDTSKCKGCFSTQQMIETNKKR